MKNEVVLPKTIAPTNDVSVAGINGRRECVSLTTDHALWTKQRSTYWWDFIANETFSRADWMENFRMSRESLVVRSTETNASIQSDTKFHKAIYVEHRLAIAV